MDWESSGVVGFDLGPLVQGQMRTAKLKSAYNSLIIGPRGFGALSLRWIQFASVLRCARSSCIPDAKRGYYGFIIVVVRALVRVRRDFLLATYSPHFFPDFFHIWQVT